MILTQAACDAKRKELKKLKSQLELIQKSKREEWQSSIKPEDIENEEKILKEEIQKIETILSQATIVTKPASETTNVAKVNEGSIVKLKADYGDGDVMELEVKIVTGTAKPMEELSPESPIGNAIMGKRAGESTEVKLPSGETAKIEILDVV